MTAEDRRLPEDRVRFLAGGGRDRPKSRIARPADPTPTRHVCFQAELDWTRRRLAPVVARMLSYNGDTATRLATAAGSPWSRYAPGDHEQ
ncbi:hypothetical protein [Nonomuraea roseoviolacea]|uniref:Uncharacterized protein n=1 Tax=Nonomuraea roseoviolacea subsp. carminata TaxID=160689 RepID=A0ABT1KEU7_9ACTN|nr:hypothetical protein [Nonomuraea roseoviolacea]MCP2352182.1 hypothetical protein [Nonomuraea roseoviolacea subsp. carminata]